MGLVCGYGALSEVRVQRPPMSWWSHSKGWAMGGLFQYALHNRRGPKPGFWSLLWLWYIQRQAGLGRHISFGQHPRYYVVGYLLGNWLPCATQRPQESGVAK